MLHWTLVFLIIALIAGALGLFGVAGAAAGIAKILFFVFLVALADQLLLASTAHISRCPCVLRDDGSCSLRMN